MLGNFSSVFKSICSPLHFKIFSQIKRKTVLVFRQQFKATKFVNIKYSKQTCRIYFTISHSKSILLISSNKIASSLLYMKRFSKYMSFKTEILLIPLLQSSQPYFEISEYDHPLEIVGHTRDH